MGRRWRGWGDRYDAYGAAVGLVTFLVTGIVAAAATGGRLAGWLAAFGIGCGVMNISSFVIRRIASGSRPPDGRR